MNFRNGAAYALGVGLSAASLDGSAHAHEYDGGVTREALVDTSRVGRAYDLSAAREGGLDPLYGMTLNLGYDRAGDSTRYYAQEDSGRAWEALPRLGKPSMSTGLASGSSE